MKRPQDLTRDELEAVVDAVQQAFYLDYDDENKTHWNPQNEWKGADTVDEIAVTLEKFGLIPSEVAPFEALPSLLRD